MLTSYADRTSPVLRGKWLLENVLGAPPPPPPAECAGARGAGRAASCCRLATHLEMHRNNPMCATCHVRWIRWDLRWRTSTRSASGGTSERTATPSTLRGPCPTIRKLKGWRAPKARREPSRGFRLTRHREAVEIRSGPGFEYYDMPTDSQNSPGREADDYRWSSIMLGIVKSRPFQMRRSES